MRTALQHTATHRKILQHTFEWHMIESCHTYEWDTCHIQMRNALQLYEGGVATTYVRLTCLTLCQSQTLILYSCCVTNDVCQCDIYEGLTLCQSQTLILHLCCVERHLSVRHMSFEYQLHRVKIWTSYPSLLWCSSARRFVCCSALHCVAVCCRSYCLISLFCGAVVEDVLYKKLLRRKAQCTRREKGQDCGGACACHTYEWVMSHIHMSHVTRTVRSFTVPIAANEWIMSRVWMSHVTHMNESCHTYTVRSFTVPIAAHEWVMSHV